MTPPPSAHEFVPQEGDSGCQICGRKREAHQ